MSFESTSQLGFGGTNVNNLAKIIGELQDQRTSVVAGAGSGVAIAIPSLTINDTVRSAISYNAGVPSDQTANTTVIDTRATGTITLSSHVVGDTVTVAGKVFTAVAAVGYAGNAKPMQYGVGATGAATADALADAINAANLGVLASASGAVVTVTAVAGGVAGNSIGLVISAHGSVSGATLAGGTATTGIKISAVTTGQTVVVTWNKKPA